MSTRREHEPAIPDRLPGEEDIARLYQQTADEQPAEALDALVLAAARGAAQPRLRLIKGGRISQMTRRWAIPLSLAATLVVTIGVVTNLKEDIGRPLMRVESEESPAVSAAAQEMQSAQSQETRRDVRKKAKQSASSTLADDAFDLKDEAASFQQKMDAPSPPVFSAQQAAQPPVQAAQPPVQAAQPPVQAAQPPVQAAQPTARAVRPTGQVSDAMTSEFREAKKEQSVAKPLRQEKRRRNERNAALLEKAEEEADAVLPAPAPEAIPQEESESLLGDARTGERIMSLDSGITTRSSKDWLTDIDQLFQAGKRREAEDSLRAFQKEYPDYTDYPDSFPQDVLERLQKP